MHLPPDDHAGWDALLAAVLDDSSAEGDEQASTPSRAGDAPVRILDFSAMEYRRRAVVTTVPDELAPRT